MARTRTIALKHNFTWMPYALLLASMCTATLAFSQRRLVDERGQAEGWYLPVHGQVLVDGKRSNDYTLVLYRDNKPMGAIPIHKKGGFELQLDIDGFYTVRITKEGYQEKMIYIDTHLPPDLVTYPDYELFVNLMPPNAKNIDPFYTDFPSAIIRWSDDMSGFYHSENYLSHIQTRLTGIASAAF